MRTVNAYAATSATEPLVPSRSSDETSARRTVSAVIDLNAYLGLLRLDGTMVNVGAPAQPLPVRVFTLFGNRRSFAGSGIGSIAETQEMLDFCAQHGLAPETELVAADYINEAYERVLASDVRYRFVLDVATLAGPAEPTG